MNVHAFQHVPFEGLGEIEPWLRERGHRITYTRFFAGDPLPALDDVDWLIVMGGPMSVHDEAEHPWLRAEKAFVTSAIKENKCILGICLGAQLMAEAGGGSVYRGAQREIGWFPIAFQDGAEAWFGTAAPLEVFHWHGETFHLPGDSVRLAESPACLNQAFHYGPRIVGLQFHLEMNSTTVRTLVENARADLAPGPYVQDEEHILQHHSPAARQALHFLLETIANAPA